LRDSPRAQSPLELLLPEGYARHFEVTGSGCPDRLLPRGEGALPGRSDLLVLAPSPYECARPGWLRTAIRGLAGRLPAGGLAYVLAPRGWRWRALSLLRGTGLDAGLFVAHLPNSYAPRQRMVPLRLPELRYALLELGPRRPSRRLLVLALRARLDWLLAEALPSVAFVARWPDSPAPFAWLGEPTPVGAVADLEWDGRDVAAVVHGFWSGPDQPSLVAKVPLSAPVRDRAQEAERLSELGPAAREAGAAVPETVAIRTLQGKAVLMETALPGRPAAGLLREQSRRLPQLIQAAVRWLQRWNELTVQPAVVGEAWLQERIAAARLIRAELGDGEQYCRRLESLARELAGGRIPLVAAHQDLSASNLLFARNGGFGVVDWEMASGAALPLVDFFYMASDLAAATMGYRSWPSAAVACFKPEGRWASQVAAQQARLTGALGISPGLATFCFHACWLGRIQRDYHRGLRERWQPFLEILRAFPLEVRA